jgi:hypothetical protein
MTWVMQVDNKKEFPKRKRNRLEIMTIVPAVHILLQYVRWKSKIVFGKM